MFRVLTAQCAGWLTVGATGAPRLLSGVRTLSGVAFRLPLHHRMPLGARRALASSAGDGKSGGERDPTDVRSFLDDGDVVPEDVTLDKLREWYINREKVMEERLIERIEARLKHQAEAARTAASSEAQAGARAAAAAAGALATSAAAADAASAGATSTAAGAAPAADADPVAVLSEALKEETELGEAVKLAQELAAAGTTDTDSLARNLAEALDSDVEVLSLEESARVRPDEILTRAELDHGRSRFHDLMPGRALQPGDSYEPEDLNPYQPPPPKNYIYSKPKMICPLCAPGAPEISFKNLHLLSRFISDTGRIMPRRRTGVCAKQQRKLARAIKLARQIGYLPYTHKHPKYADVTIKPKTVNQY